MKPTSGRRSSRRIFSPQFKAKDVLEEALFKFGAPETVNTDQGSQFTAEEFVQCVHDSNAKLSMDEKGVWRSIKYARVYLTAYEIPSQARQDIND